MIDSKGHLISFPFRRLYQRPLKVKFLDYPQYAGQQPTGFALSDEEWRQVLDVCRFHEKQESD